MTRRDLLAGARLSFWKHGLIKGLVVGLVQRFWRSRYVRGLFSKKIASSADLGKSELKGFAYTVVIPVNNGLTRGLPALVESLKKQTLIPARFIVVDSGSVDGTQSWCEAKGDIHLIEIEPRKFSHSYSRNIGLDEVKTEFALFTVDDAEFTDSQWVEKALSTLISTGAASVSGVQIPRPSADAYSRAKSDSHVEAIAAFGTFVSRKGFISRRFRQLAPFWAQYPSIGIDDTNHFARTDALRSVRFRGHSCEDLMVAIDLNLSGYTTAFRSSLEVNHSHEYSLKNAAGYARRVYLDNLVLADINHFPLRSLTPSEAIFGCLSGLANYLENQPERNISNNISVIEYLKAVYTNLPLVKFPSGHPLAQWMCNTLENRLQRLQKLGIVETFQDQELVASLLTVHIISTLLANGEYSYASSDYAHSQWQIADWR